MEIFPRDFYEPHEPGISHITGDWATGATVHFETCMTVIICMYFYCSVPFSLPSGCQAIRLKPKLDDGFFGFRTCAIDTPLEKKLIIIMIFTSTVIHAPHRSKLSDKLGCNQIHVQIGGPA